MITLFVIILLTLLISTYKIKKKCGGWKDFDVFNSGFVLYMAFHVSSFTLLIYLLFIIAILINSGILP